ncbi:sporulation-specific diadenylate cyclase CdaS [Ammoniphilus sp. 3BR4]|uniref:sporulation-specific diadenylate cyclase CdaS n=1 Tax=Ammoniphilus sp. 3BR4 TaxID=3158265 RepID=UPI003466927F
MDHCDFSPMKNRLKEYLHQVDVDLHETMRLLDKEDCCLLSDFKHIREKLTQIEMAAASFYLQCYLAPYTDKSMELSMSIQNLSLRRHGALIVFERQDPLDGILQAGVSVDAHFTPSLMESIFYPGSPLHDGAVLLRGNKIVSAAHVLPLSHVLADTKKLGTRHRAALGLTEVSDALVIVISEETGNASFALQGTLYPISTGVSIH